MRDHFIYLLIRVFCTIGLNLYVCSFVFPPSHAYPPTQISPAAPMGANQVCVLDLILS